MHIFTLLKIRSLWISCKNRLRIREKRENSFLFWNSCPVLSFFGFKEMADAKGYVDPAQLLCHLEDEEQKEGERD